MKLFFISDIHGSITDLEYALSKYAESSSDYLVILGDILNHGPRNPLPENYNPQKVAATLNKYANSIICIRGNCDSEVDQMLLNFPILSDFSQILLDNHYFFLTHGHIFTNEKLNFLRENSVICSGHTHIPVAEKNGDLYYFNPGSITFPKENNSKSYGIYENNTLSIISFENKLIKELKL